MKKKIVYSYLLNNEKNPLKSLISTNYVYSKPSRDQIEVKGLATLYNTFNKAKKASEHEFECDNKCSRNIRKKSKIVKITLEIIKRD